MHLPAAEALLATPRRAAGQRRVRLRGRGGIELASTSTAWLEANRERLAADVAIISDTGFFEGNLPAITRRPARASCTPRSTSSAPPSTSTRAATAAPSRTRPTPWPRSSPRSRARTAGSAVPGFYDDVVGRCPTRTARPSPRCRSTRTRYLARPRAAGARRRGRLHDARAPRRPADARRQRHLGRLPGRGHQDDHPGPRPRQGQLPARRRPGSGPDLRRVPRLRRGGRAARRDRRRSGYLGGGPAEPDPDRPSGDAGRRAGPRGDLRPGAGLHPRGRLDPGLRQLRDDPRPAGRAARLHPAGRATPTPRTSGWTSTTTRPASGRSCGSGTSWPPCRLTPGA